MVQVRYRQHGRWISQRRPMFVMTSGFAAAAAIAVIMLFPLRAGGNLEKVNRAVNSVSNVHVLRYSRTDELIQEIWMSRSLGFKLYKESQNVLFKNLRSGIILQARPGNEPSEHEGIREHEQYARLLPFEQLRDLPPGYTWNFRGESVLDSRHVRIYELVWDTGGPSLVIRRKWRGYLDEKTCLPYKIEWLEQVADQEYELSTTLLIDYPTEAQCLEQLNVAGFQRFLKDDHSE
jgi:hypothetical protein